MKDLGATYNNDDVMGEKIKACEGWSDKEIVELHDGGNWRCKSQSHIEANNKPTQMENGAGLKNNKNQS